MTETIERSDELITPALLPIGSIRVKEDFNPRLDFDEEDILELEWSIRKHGVLAPITVQRVTGETYYELIAGERRLRAARRIGLTEIPAVIREDHSELEQIKMALAENLMRRDLNPVELAKTFDKLHNKYNMTQGGIAVLLPGKHGAPYVSNLMRILSLPADVLDLVSKGKLSYSHAIELVPIGHLEGHAVGVAATAVAEGLSVSAVREQVREIQEDVRRKEGQTAIEVPIAPSPQPVSTSEYTEEISSFLPVSTSAPDAEDQADVSTSKVDVAEPIDADESELPAEGPGRLEEQEAEPDFDSDGPPAPPAMNATPAPALKAETPKPVEPVKPVASSTVTAMITKEHDDWLWEKELTVGRGLDLLVKWYEHILASESELEALQKENE